MRQIVLDTETTGLDAKQGHRIIEIGCIELLNRKITSHHFHYYINPEREIDAGALAVHGLSESFLKSKPLFSAIVDEFIHFIKDAELIIHNASFDIGFIEAELQRLNAYPKKITELCTVTDTLILARKKYPGQKNSLDALCKRFEIDNTNRALHGALLDAQLLAQIYLRLTGGQRKLSLEHAVVESANTTQTTPLNLETVDAIHNLPVILATPDEIEGHKALLALLKRHDAQKN